MRILNLLFGFSVFVAVAPQANAASRVYGCFETEQAAEQFVENLEARDAAFHEDQTKLETLVETPGLSHWQLRFIFGNELEEGDRTDVSSVPLKHVSSHIHLTADDIERSPKGEGYCLNVWSASHMYIYTLTVDLRKNKILTTRKFTEISH